MTSTTEFSLRPHGLTGTITCRLASAVLLAGCLIANAAAEPLPKETCETVKTEQDALIAAGIKDDMAKGPDWAKSNLRRDRLKEVERFIDLEEQLNFRCGLAKAKLTVPEEATPAAEPSPKAEVKAKPKPRPRPKAVPAPAEAAAEPQATEPAPQARPQPKPRPRPKADDAYKPPAGSPTTDPFAKAAPSPKG